MFISGVAAPHAITHEPDGSDVLYKDGATVDNPTIQPNTDIGGSFIKKKETRFVKLPARSTLTISYEVRRVSGAAPSHSKLYRNGTPVGTPRQNDTTTFVKYTEDIDEWDTGDLLQVYLAHSSGSGATTSEVKNLTAVYKEGINGVTPFNQDP